MPHLSCHLIPKDVPEDSPLWEKYAFRVRALRLDSLKMDPDSFISRYESEVKQPIEFSIGRLAERNAWSVVLLRTPNQEAAREPEVLLKDDTDYVGFCVMIDIRSESPSMAKREGVDNSAQDADWFMAAVYVDRSVRGIGAGKKMISFGLDVIRRVTKETGGDSAICVTSVVHGNTVALETYKKLGFKVTKEDEVEEKEGRSYHTTQLKMSL